PAGRRGRGPWRRGGPVWKSSCAAGRWVGSGRDLSLGFLRETPLVLNAQDLAGDARRELARKAAHLVAELLPHPLVIRLRGRASLGDDLLGLRDRLAGFLLLHAGRGGPGLLDQL